MVNKVTLIGRLGKDPEVRTLETGTSFAKFQLATNESYKDKNGEWQTITDWHSLVLWRELAERAEKQLKKGYLVYIEGKLSNRSWKDEHGETKYITEVRVETFRLLEGDTSSASKVKDNSQNNQVISIPVDTADDLPF